MEEKSLLLQVAHGVADGRRRYAKTEPPGDRARSSRLSSLHIRLDDGLQYPAFTIVELMSHKSKYTNDFQRGSSPRRGRPDEASQVG